MPCREWTCAAKVVGITHASTCVDSDLLGARFTSSSSLAFYASSLVCMAHHTPPTAVTAYRPAGTLPLIYTRRELRTFAAFSKRISRRDMGVHALLCETGLRGSAWSLFARLASSAFVLV
jgi:hypothetical protein